MLAMKDQVTAYELKHSGGKWLGEAREYLKWHVRGGDTCTWGSHTQLPITVAQIEDLAAHVAAVAINEERKKCGKN